MKKREVNQGYKLQNNLLKQFAISLRCNIPSIVRDCSTNTFQYTSQPKGPLRFLKIESHNEKGFTLIEVIVTLILVGITAALAGIWIVSVANGYIFARTNASVSQKAQLALNRLTKEFSAIQTVDVNTANTNGTKITYTRTRVTSGTPGTATVVLSFSGSALQLNVAGSGAQTLTDSVSAFALAYCDSPNSTSCPATWSTTSRIIEISLTLTAGSNTPVTFTRRVTPRNI